MSDESSDRWVVVLLAIAVEGGLIVLAWGLGWLLGHPPLDKLAWDVGDALWGALAAVPMLVLFLAAVRWPVGPFRSIKAFTDQVIRPLLASCSVLDLLGISVLAGLGEELLFRGVLQGAFARWMPPATAVALAGVLFGVLHAVTASYAVLAALMGAYLGALYLATGNLLTPVVTHALYDFLVLWFLMRGPGSDVPGEAAPEEEPVGKEGAPEP
jgi:membrane protease YdiL (CAAX protease family)